MHIAIRQETETHRPWQADVPGREHVVVRVLGMIMCASAMQARRSPDSGPGQSFRMISGVTPSANGLRTSSAEIRMSRTMG